MCGHFLKKRILAFTAEAVSDRCSGGGGDQQKQWQDEISTGFERLVAYATQVDSRRKSNDSLGQPQPPPPPPPTNYQKPEADKRSPPPPPPPPPPAAAKDPYDRMSALSMKFKRAATGGYAESSAAAAGHRHPVSPSGLGGLPQRASTSGTPKRSGLSATSSIPPELLMAEDRSQSPPPPPSSSSSESKNLPEHHFKKRYFAASRQQSSDSFDSGGGGVAPSAMGPSATVHQQPVLNMKKRPSLLGSSRQMSRSSPEPEDNGDGNEGDGSYNAAPAPTK